MKEIIFDMTNEGYHAAPGMSNSKLSAFSEDPHSLEWMKHCPQDAEKVATFDFGTALHLICLEPHKLASEFIEMPAFNLRTNAGKESKAEFYAEYQDKKILTSDEFKKLHLMFDSVMAHPEARELIESDGVAESSYFWTDQETGLVLKCRPDKIVGNMLIDVKSTPDLKGFARSVEDYRYWIQAPWYIDIVRNFQDVEDMLFLAVSKNASIGRYPVAVYRLPPEIVEYGRITMRRELNEYAEFLSGGKKAPTQYLEMSRWFTQEADEAVNQVII